MSTNETAEFPCQRFAGELIPIQNIKILDARNPRTEQRPNDILEDVEPTLKDGCTLNFPTLLKEGDERITYEVMRSNAKAKDANLGLVDAKFVLNNQHLIPNEMKGKGLLFTGTLLRDFHGGLSIPVLYCGSDGWRLSFHPLSKDGKYDGWPGWSLIGDKKTSDSR